jgi:hypothetical protein
LRAEFLEKTRHLAIRLRPAEQIALTLRAAQSLQIGELLERASRRLPFTLPAFHATLGCVTRQARRTKQKTLTL